MTFIVQSSKCFALPDLTQPMKSQDSSYSVHIREKRRKFLKNLLRSNLRTIKMPFITKAKTHNNVQHDMIAQRVHITYW